MSLQDNVTVIISAYMEMQQNTLVSNNSKRLTWTLLDTKCSVGVLGSGVVLQLERCGVVHEGLRALGHTGSAVVEIGTSLQREHEHSQLEAWGH